MGDFKAEKVANGDEVKVKLQGHIDEDAQFNSLALGSAKKVVLDLDSVTAINSCGIREWIKWIRTAQPSSQIVYQNCPKVIVDQINMVAGFLPDNGKVESFYVPLFRRKRQRKDGVVSRGRGI
jgi:anti-anti-sigma regulatory factor